MIKSPSMVWVRKQAEKRQKKLQKLKNQEIIVPEFASPRTLAALLDVRTIDILKILIKMNECPSTSEDFLHPDLLDMVVQEFGRIPVRGRDQGFDLYPRTETGDPSKYPRKCPVVTIMGHVDHGKTTLLDSLRGSSIAANEHGGITQRMASFSVKLPSSPYPITFVDTPGHEAFTRMRQRGAEVTDIAVLVIAADEGIQEQTEQAYKFIEEVGCPMIVALNKCDKPDADPEKVRLSLNSRGIRLAKYGGQILDVEISALEQTGLDELQESVLYIAEDMNLTADDKGAGEAEILDVRREEYRGVVASCILRLGEIKKGDPMVAGWGCGKVKGLFDENSKPIATVKPGMPFEVTGWDTAPSAGDELLVAPDMAKAKAAAEFRKNRIMWKSNDKKFAQQRRREARDKEMEQKDRIQAVQLGIDPGKFVRKQQQLRNSLRVKEIPIVIKADSAGTIEAVLDAFNHLPSEEIKLRILRSEVGSLSEQDVTEASMMDPKAILVSFNSTLTERVRSMASRENIDISNFKLIYSLVDWIRRTLGKHLKPREHLKIISEAQVQSLYPFKGKKGITNVAGCTVTNGTLRKKKLTQVIRNGQVIFEGAIRTLRHLKQEVNEITTGTECGVLMNDSVEFQVGDVIQNVERKFIPRILGEPIRSKGSGVEQTTEDDIDDFDEEEED